MVRCLLQLKQMMSKAGATIVAHLFEQRCCETMLSSALPLFCLCRHQELFATFTDCGKHFDYVTVRPPVTKVLKSQILVYR